MRRSEKKARRFAQQGERAIIQEIDRQILERQDVFIQYIDAMILWTLRVELRFGKKRLERFYRAVIRNYKELCELYQTDSTYPAIEQLKKIGVDLDELRKENT